MASGEVFVAVLLVMTGVGFSPRRSPKGSAADVAEEAWKLSAEELVFIIGGVGFKKSDPLEPEISSSESILLLLPFPPMGMGGGGAAKSLKRSSFGMY